jgi:hypothetical protein
LIAGSRAARFRPLEKRSAASRRSSVAAVGCAERTARRSLPVTATRSTRLSQPWHRHSWARRRRYGGSDRARAPPEWVRSDRSFPRAKQQSDALRKQ